MGKLITGIHHVSIKCSNDKQFQEVKHFYKDILSLDLVRTWGVGKDSGMMFDTGIGLIEVFNNGSQDLPQGNIRHFALTCSNVDRCVQIIKEAGYEVFVEPKDIVINSNPPFPARIAFCKGPIGEQIELFQEK